MKIYVSKNLWLPIVTACLCSAVLVMRWLPSETPSFALDRPNVSERSAVSAFETGAATAKATVAATKPTLRSDADAPQISTEHLATEKVKANVDRIMTTKLPPLPQTILQSNATEIQVAIQKPKQMPPSRTPAIDPPTRRLPSIGSAGNTPPATAVVAAPIESNSALGIQNRREILSPRNASSIPNSLVGSPAPTSPQSLASVSDSSEVISAAWQENSNPKSEPAGSSFFETAPAPDRYAMLPQDNPKPRFKKFASTATDTEEDDDDDDESLQPKQPTILSASDRWKPAGQPKKGDRYKDDTPLTDSRSLFIEGAHGNFSSTPTMPEIPYDPAEQIDVYSGKTLYSNQRPILELGRPWYQLGPISEGSSLLGFHNHINPQYLLFGDFRTGFASNRQNNDTNSLVATQLNLIHHLKITSTERFVAGMSPLGAANNTRYEFDNNRTVFEGDADFDFGFIEADLGAIAGGFMGETLPFDLPVALGIMPLVFQNGVWFEDAILGAAVTIPARNSPLLDISNMDITFFAGYDKLDSPAFQGDDSAARIMGIATFIEALNGYFEVDYAFLDDRSDLDRSYHNFAFAYTRRFGRFLSHSTRVIVNAGQASVAQDNTADGVLLISENSLITGSPSTVVPYLNMWAGFDRPQSAARAGIAGGILRNTGILFESDNLTGYPTLDATANDTFGMALGLNLLADEFAQQLIVEAAMLGVMGEDANRNTAGDQYGLGARYQLPLSNSVIFRADAMYGFLRNDADINGVRMELRKKW